MFLENREQGIQKAFEERLMLFGEKTTEILQGIMSCSPKEALCAKFLYHTMPLADVASYDFDTFLDYVKQGVFLYEERPFKEKVPDDIFLNYILYHRINEEEITPCRTFFYKQLKERIAGKTMREAAIEVNYWCSEEATYQSTDERTVAAMTVFKGAYGRCGEESTFTVSALRSVGIPARQVYAPRWSHCDDNHAWVEVYVDGKWHFLGACEPEEILNKGWFTNASSRAMLIHSRWFDDVKPQEEIISKQGVATLVNHTNFYAHTNKVEVTVCNEQGHPVQGVEVHFEIMNYAEFYPIASIQTNHEGKAYLTTGLGSLHLYAVHNGHYAEQYIDTRQVSSVTLTPHMPLKKESWEEHELIAPVDAPIHTELPTKEQKVIGKEKVKKATQKRLMKVEKFLQGDYPVYRELARGNFKEIEDFLKVPVADEMQIWKEKMLKVISKKDFRDCQCSVLQEHLEYAIPFSKDYEEEIFISYVLNPRIELEPMTAYRDYITHHYTESQKDLMKKCPNLIWEMIEEHIQSDETFGYSNITTSPVGCLKLQRASERSKKILFVAICRTLGIPARLNPIDQMVEYYRNGTFNRVTGEKKDYGTLILKSGEAEVNWEYFQNWSLAKLEKGRYQSLDLKTQVWEEEKLTLELECGTYRLITANRLPNGNIFAKTHILELEVNEVKELTLSLKEAKLSEMLELVNLQEFELQTETGEKIKASSILSQDKMLLIWLEHSKEPTEHILNELYTQQSYFNKFGKKICWIIKDESALEDPTLKKVRSVLPNVQIYYDDFEENVQTLGRRMYVDPDKLPLIIVTDKGMGGLYATSGYNVGTADMLKRIFEES